MVDPLPIPPGDHTVTGLAGVACRCVSVRLSGSGYAVMAGDTPARRAREAPASVARRAIDAEVPAREWKARLEMVEAGGG
jgi:hypothetical protein